jgi:hypothetical protein
MSWEFWVRVTLFNGPIAFGLVYLFTTRGRSPRATRLAMAALVLILLANGAAAVPNWIIRLRLAGPNWQPAPVNWMLIDLGFLLGHAVGVCLLIWSVAVDRRPTLRTTDEQPAQ